jgi:hypothetical protein
VLRGNALYASSAEESNPAVPCNTQWESPFTSFASSAASSKETERRVCHDLAMSALLLLLLLLLSMRQTR